MLGVNVVGTYRRHAQWVERLLGALGTWAVAVLASLAPIWQNNSENQRGGVALAGILALWVGVLTVRALGRSWRLAALAVVAGLGLFTVPTIGRVAVLAGLGLALGAFSVLVEWDPWPGWPGRRHQVTLAAVPFLAAAGLVWATRQSLPLTALLLGCALVVVEAEHRRVPSMLALEGAARRVVAGAVVRGQRAWEPVVALGIGTSVRSSLRSAAAVVRRPAGRRDWWLAAALGVGGLLRTWWAVAYTRVPSDVSASPVIGDYYSTMNLRAAEAFAAGHTPSIGGIPTAIWPPGTGGVLAPFGWVSAHTGWFELYQAGSFVNVVAGTLTIWFCAALAQRWFGRAARNPAAWLMALAPSPLFITSVSILEPLAMALMTGSVLAATVIVQDRAPGQRQRALFALGMLVGYSVLTTDRAGILVLVPALIVRAVDGRWTGLLRTVGTVAAGALVLVLPWTVRNGIQVGWWSPNATSIPEGMCTVKYQYGTELATADIRSPRFLPLAEDCFRGSPFDNPALGITDVYPEGWRAEAPAEGEQAKRNTSGAVRWYVTHPRELLSSAPERLWAVGGNDDTGGLDYASHFDRLQILTPGQRSLATDAANTWYAVVAVLSVVALISRRRVRAAVPLWLIPLVILVQPILGPYGFSRHFLMGYPFLAILAAAVIGTAAAEEPVTAAGGTAPTTTEGL